jgi:hypothetical protein
VSSAIVTFRQISGPIKPLKHADFVEKLNALSARPSEDELANFSRDDFSVSCIL